MIQQHTGLLNARDICMLDGAGREFAICGADGSLYLYDAATESLHYLAKPEHIATQRVNEQGESQEQCLKLYAHYPYLVVSERFGLHAWVTHLESSKSLCLTREDYHADVSSYSIAFVQQGKQTLLLHQKAWNSLEVTVLEHAFFGTEAMQKPTASPQHREVLDYFHSLLHVSPDGKYVLSNGWVWHPVDMIRYFSVESLVRGEEQEGARIDYFGGYNWDRPLAFVSDVDFVVAVDKNSQYDDEDMGPDEYKQLHFFRITDAADGIIPCHHALHADLFPCNEEGELSGQLYYDPHYKTLVAISGKGSFVLNLHGKVLASNVGMNNTQPNGPMWNNTPFFEHCQWQYSAGHHLWYSLSPEGELCLVGYKDFVDAYRVHG